MEYHGFDLGHLFYNVAWTFFANPAAFETAIGHQIGAPEWRPIDHVVAAFAIDSFSCFTFCQHIVSQTRF